MIFAAKPKGLFVEFANHSRRVVRANVGAKPVIVEEFAECEEHDEEGWGQIVEHFLPKKATHGLLQAVCSIYPDKRLVRRATIEPKKLKDASYLGEFAASQFRIEPSRYKLGVLHADSGADYNVDTAIDKDVMIVGMPTEDIDATQEHLLEESVYPDRLEIGTLACLGALADYLRFNDIKTPVMVLELEHAATPSFIVSADGVEATRLLPHGLNSMVPVVQKELGLKDEESARKLFLSNTFDFTGMGPALIKRLQHELQSSIGFFEVQTGQSIGHVFCLNLAGKLVWLEQVLANQLGLSLLELNMKPWLESRGITFSPDAAEMELTRDWFGVLSLMPRYDAAETQKNG